MHLPKTSRCNDSRQKRMQNKSRILIRSSLFSLIQVCKIKATLGVMYEASSGAKPLAVYINQQRENDHEKNDGSFFAGVGGSAGMDQPFVGHA